MSQVTFSFLLTTLAGLSTLLGSIFIFFPIKNQNLFIARSLGFASGVMIFVSFFDLLPESYHSIHQTFTTIPTVLISSIFFILGILISFFLSFLTKKKEEKGSSLYQVGILSTLAIILHNIPEGIATFLTTNYNKTLGITLSIAIALHNIPEGISISVPIYFASKSRLKAIFYTFLSGMSELFGSFFAYFFFRDYLSDHIMGMLYSIIAGIMISISVDELIPTSLRYSNLKNFLCSFLFGIFLMFFSHTLLS